MDAEEAAAWIAKLADHARDECRLCPDDEKILRDIEGLLIELASRQSEYSFE